MQLITIGFIKKWEKTEVNAIERWLYSGGIKRFLYNIQKNWNTIAPYIISVVELGKVDDEELENMLDDGYMFMETETFGEYYK